MIRSALFERIAPYKLKPAPGYIPDKLETGTQNHEGIAGLRAAIDFLASLGQGETRRERILSAFERIEAHEERLAASLREQLARIPGVHLYQGGLEVQKTPTVAFRIKGLAPRQVCEWMAEEASIFIADGDFYATTLAGVAGVADDGGWVRAGFALYNTEEEVERFVKAMEALVRTA